MALGAGIGILSKALPVITGLGKAGAWTAAGTGVATGLTAGGLKIGQALGLAPTLEDIARGEKVDIGDASLLDEKGNVTKVEGYDFFDRFRDGVLGYSEADVATAKGNQIRKGINRANRVARNELAELRTSLGLETGDQYLKIQPGQTKEDVDALLQKEEAILTGLQQIKQHASGLGDHTKLGPKPTLSAVSAELSRLNNEDDYGERGTRVHQREEAEKAVTREMTRHRDNQELLLAQLVQQGNTSNNQFALQMAQQDYNNRALEMRDARDSRKDRQLMIMQLMKGLSDMGKAFAY